MRRNTRTTKVIIPLFALILAIGAAACGDDDGTTAPTDTGMGDMTDMDDDHTDDHDETFAFGEPADAADADRTIEIEAQDIMFDVTEVEVAVGETITFVVTNTGAAVHDFALGDAAFQAEHEEEMAEMGTDMMAHDDVNAFTVDPGQTKELTWHFTEAGEVLYGCHQPGHYDAGMVGTITVS